MLIIQNILICYSFRISVSRTDQLGEAEQIDQDNLDLRCLQVSIDLQ